MGEPLRAGTDSVLPDSAAIAASEAAAAASAAVAAAVTGLPRNMAESNAGGLGPAASFGLGGNMTSPADADMADAADMLSSLQAMSAAGRSGPPIGQLPPGMGPCFGVLQPHFPQQVGPSLSCIPERRGVSKKRKQL